MRTLCIIGAITLLTGCTQTVWEKQGATQFDLDTESARCRMVARGTPMPYSPPSAPTYSATTTVIGNTAYTTLSPAADPGAGMQQLGSTMMYIAKRESIYNDCMISLGWRQQSPQSAAAADAKRQSQDFYASSLNVNDPSGVQPIETRTVIARNKTTVRERPSINSPAVVEVDENAALEAVGATEKWFRVETGGRAGYVAKIWVDY